MPGSSPNPFANLRQWVEWLTDEGKVSSCCLLATAEDLKLRPDKFDCGRCEWRLRWSDLWPENQTAWDCYQAMRRRTVMDVQAGAWVLETFTAGWSWQRVEDLLKRIDLILEIVAPLQPTEGHGRRTQT